MTIWIPDLSSHRGPRYLAIADALATDIRSSRLSPGDRLPTHRELAYQLGVTVGTVTRAYGEAERRGLIGGEVQPSTPQEFHDRIARELAMWIRVVDEAKLPRQ